MDLKSKKGYSLIEIGVGILILTVFLICSLALFNGCYNTYRMIQQRNIAVNLAVSNMETLLQSDADVLTGFFIQEVDSFTNKYNYIPSAEFETFVTDNFNSDFKGRYAKINNLNVSSVGTPSTDELQEYIYADKDFLINSFIEDEVTNYSTDEMESAEVQSGDYGLLVPSVTESGNEALLYPGVGTPSAIIGEMAVRTTVTRLPMTEDYAYGNKVLKIKVEVFYTNKINLTNLTDEDVKAITLESVKVSD